MTHIKPNKDNQATHIANSKQVTKGFYAKTSKFILQLSVTQFLSFFTNIGIEILLKHAVDKVLKDAPAGKVCLKMYWAQ